MAHGVDLAGAAGLVYLSPSRFRQVWRVWVRELGFPSPFRSPADGSNYAWDADAIADWKADRSRRNLNAAPRVAANDSRRPRAPAAHDPTPARLARERARLHELQQGGK